MVMKTLNDLNLESNYDATINAIGCYTRSVSSMLEIMASNNITNGFEYPDLRGLPIEDEAYMQSIFSFLGVTELKENGRRFIAKYSGWRSYNSGDPVGYAIIDQMPPYKYPNVANNKVYVLAGKLLQNEKKPVYKKPDSISPKMNIIVPCCNLHGNNYYMPHNNILYELDNIEGRVSIAGILESNIPNLVGQKYDAESNKLVDYELDENYIIEVIDDYYHKNADGTTILYQFPTNRHFANVDKIYIVVPTSNNINDYDIVLIPDLRGLTINEINHYSSIFDIKIIGECVSAYSHNIIADQFPRGGVWFCKKGVEKIKLYVMLGMGNYHIISRLLNYVI